MKFEVITIFPELIEAFAKESLLAKAQKNKLIQINVHNLRDYSTDKHKTVDDRPFGGGLGMVLKVEPIAKAVTALRKKKGKSYVILFTPRGKKFNQAKAQEFSKLDQLLFICGRYEGVDERIAEYVADEEFSMGEYVLMGGEIPAMAVIETVSRLIPGVVGKPEFLKERNIKKSFIEYPQYTRPEVYKGWNTPKVLVSGDHKKIEEWRRKHGKIIEK